MFCDSHRGKPANIVDRNNTVMVPNNKPRDEQAIHWIGQRGENLYERRGLASSE